MSLPIAIVCFSTVASADLKIKTRTTVMGHTTESTVYIKGGRERNETSFGGHGGAVSIIQCDQKRMITVSGNQCMVMSDGRRRAVLSHDAEHGGHGPGDGRRRAHSLRVKAAL